MADEEAIVNLLQHREFVRASQCIGKVVHRPFPIVPSLTTCPGPVPVGAHPPPLLPGRDPLLPVATATGKTSTHSFFHLLHAL